MADRMPINIWHGEHHHQLPQEYNVQLENNTYKRWKKDSRGQHQVEDLLKGLINSTTSVVAMIPMTRIRQIMEVEYQLKKGSNTSSHLMLMDDIKEVRRDLKEIGKLIQTVRIASGDKTEFGTDTCALINNSNNIKGFYEKGYIYLGTMQGKINTMR